jgi:hypothetical protein
VPALEPVEALRVVATPAALDGARWTGDAVDVIRIAPDEALALGATSAEVDDADAIIEPEAGFSVALLGRDDVRAMSGHVEWALPDDPGRLVQGKIAGVPAKFRAGEPALVIIQTAYADELELRLGWR